MHVSKQSAGARVLSVREGSGDLFHELGGNFASIVEDPTTVLPAPIVRAD